MEEFIRSLARPIGCFVKRTYSVMFSLEYKSIFAIANVEDQPALLISNEKEQKVYFLKNPQYHFSSNSDKALLAYKDDNIWILEERYRNGRTICQVGLGNPPKIPWIKFII